MNKYLILLLTTGLLSIEGYCLADNRTITFPHACATGKSIVIAAVGDVIIHRPLLVKGNHSGFESLWQDALYYIKSSDIAYANLEGPIAANISENGKFIKKQIMGDPVYTSYPAFNYPPSLGAALKKSGFMIVSTGNNHALDRFSIGIDKTIEQLNKNGLAHVGTRSKNADTPWTYITTKNSIRVAWIACTESTNDNPDTYHQVLHCYGRNDRPAIIKKIQELKNKVDAIIVVPHWGEEYHSKPNLDQREFAHDVLNAGALAVIGSHPHVLQPLQTYKTRDGRETFVMYSMGNFISSQGEPKQRSTIILLLGLTKNEKGTFINGIRFVPMYMQNRGDSKNLRLQKLDTDAMTKQQLNSIYSNVLPMGNILFSESIVTNPECMPEKK